MSYVGKWKFHSIGIMNGNDELMYMNSDEYLISPMLYIDESDEELVAEEIKERRQTIGSQIAVCEDGKLYMLMPLPEGVSKEEVEQAVKEGIIKLYDGMMTDEPKLSDGNEYITFMTTRYIKSN